MTEGRKSQVIFPDERILDILIQPKLTTGELLDIVSSHFKLKEKEYFGIAFQDETSHYNWLQLDKKVLEHDLPRKQGANLVLFFLVRFYVESITQLKDTSTVELFYLNAKQAVFKGQIECDSETVFELAAHVLQASVGDYVDDATSKLDLKKLPLITTSALKEHPSIQYCEDRVIQYYQKLSGTAKGSAIVNYMTIVESLQTYGIHYFEVKDKKDIPWWLGISYKGIGVYDKNDKNVPRKVFVWKSLENLYYRDKKFSVEVHDPKRVVHTLSSFNLYEDAIREPINESDELSDAISDPSTQVSVSRRTFGPGNVNVHAWFGATQQLTKCIWLMAVAQHQFYHDRKHSRVNLPSVRSVSELASELSRSRTSLTGSLGSSDISRSGSSASLPSLGASRFDLNFDPADTAKVQREMCSALKARREALEDILKKRTEELKLLCIKEGELTGHLPAEIPLAPGEQPPQIRRRVGTAFSLSANVVPGDKEDEDLNSGLQLELELQKQITNAAHKLASDKSVSRYVRKQRRQSFIKAQSKLKEMEKKLSDNRKGGGKDSKSGSKDGHKKSSPARRVSSPAQSPLVPRGPKSNYSQHEGRLNESPIHRSATAPRELNPDPGSMISLTPTLSSPSLELSHEATNPLCSTQYQTYPNLPNLNQRSGSSCSNHSNQSDYDNNRTGGRLEGSQIRLEGSQDSGFSSTNNMYGVSSRRTSRYESNKDLVSPSDSHREGIDTVFDNKLSLQSKHGSLENTSAYRKPPHGYGSLERNLRKKSDRRYERKHSDTDTNTNYNDLTPAKFGSKRTSQSEYDLSSKGSEFSSVNNLDFPSSSRKFSYDSRTPSTDYTSSRTPSVDYSYKSDHYTPTLSRKLIEVPVMHEGYSSRSDHHHSNDYHSQSRTGWHDAAAPEPSPMIRSPTKSHSDNYLSAGKSRSEQYGSGDCYSPRNYEGSREGSRQKPHHTEISVKPVESLYSIPQATSSKIVTIAKSSPHLEVSKPFEMTDFFKYSERLRRLRLVEQYQQELMGSRSSSPSHHSSDSDPQSPYHRPHPQPHPAPAHSQFRSGSNPSPINSPLSSRHMKFAPISQDGDHSSYGNSVSQTYNQGGVSTTMSRVQYTVQSHTGQVLYKAQHHSSKQTHYQPPTAMKCNPVRDSPQVTMGNNVSHSGRPKIHHQRQRSTPERTLNSMNSPSNSSFHLSPPGSLSRAFSNEMLEWIDGDGNQPATSV